MRSGPRPHTGASCPAGAATVADYGGVRLALRPGDVLKIRLVNRLPPLDPNKLKHAKEAGQANLFRNPTNLHTHGLIVAPRTPTADDPTYGDYVFVQAYNPANGTPQAQSTHQHGSNVMDFLDYKIEIPASHPPGLYWFHPHIHGISLNQVTSGLAGIITIGDVHNYAGNAPRVVRHLMLQDIQVLAAGALHYDFDEKPVNVADGEVQHQQISDFCEPPDNGGPASRHGFCDGEPAGTSGNNFVHSRWYFTVNGQVFPEIPVKNQDGEIWRLTNASAQVSYRLELDDDSTNMPIFMQLLALDGASIGVPAGTPAGTIMAIGGNRFTAADCPVAGKAPVCISDLTMMPSSRAEVWVTYRRSDGSVATPPPNAKATLKQLSAALGKGAETWPQLKLAQIDFAQSAPKKDAIDVVGARMAVSSAPARRAGMAALLLPPPAEHAAASACGPLAQGHRRRIFFGTVNPSDANRAFGLGYEEVDQNGDLVVGTQTPVTAFDPAQTLICLPLKPGGNVVHETWELINPATETHNFHIHQTKFRYCPRLPRVSRRKTRTQSEFWKTMFLSHMGRRISRRLRTRKMATAPSSNGVQGSARQHRSCSIFRSRRLATLSFTATFSSTRTARMMASNCVAARD